MNRIVIIGSGITGMAAALLYAQQDRHADIVVLEASQRPAPLLAGFRRKGMHFDTGFHCAGGLREGGLLRLWLQTLGMWQHIGHERVYPMGEEFHFQKHDSDGADIWSFPRDCHTLLAHLAEHFGAEASTHFAHLLADMGSVLEKSPYTNPRCHALPQLSWENSQSLTHTLQNYSLPAALQQMVKARCLLYGLTADEATFHDYALVGGLYFDSCHGITGGGKTLVDAALQAMEGKNIEVRCHSPVLRIVHKDKAFHAVELANGDMIEATTCIFTGHPSQLPRMIESGVFRPAFFQHIKSMEETACALTLYGESEHPYLNERAVYLLPSDYDANILSPLGSPQPTAYVVGGRHGESRHCAQSSHSRGFPFVAVLPLYEREFLHVEKPRPVDYARKKAEKSQQAVDYVRRRLPMLGRITIHESATAATMQDWIYGGSGSLYGVAHSTATVPLLPVTRMKNFFLAGQNILLPGILGGIVSAALAVGFATDHHKVLEGFRACAHNASS